MFAVTNFWETFSVETEIAQGKNIADVSKEEGVQHLVWSSLLNITKCKPELIYILRYLNPPTMLDNWTEPTRTFWFWQ